jgi:peptide/nickel transport system substrate-binding protein
MMAAIDRPALVAQALDGYGTVGNDIAGAGMPLFDTSLPAKQQDIEKAKSLLKSAGMSTVNVTLGTAPIFAGFVESATLLAEQVKPAGFNVKILQQQPATYLVPAPSGVWLKEVFGQDKWPMTSLQSYYTQALTSSCPYPESHWADPNFDKLLAKAIGEPDQTKSQTYWNQVQEIQYNEGGNLIWAQPNNVDATSAKVAGITPGGPFELGGFAFWDAYFS